MTKVIQEHGYYIVDELGRFHSEGDEPTISIDNYIDIVEDVEGNITENPILGYKAWYNHGEFIRSERNVWQ